MKFCVESLFDKHCKFFVVEASGVQALLCELWLVTELMQEIGLIDGLWQMSIYLVIHE